MAPSLGALRPPAAAGRAPRAAPHLGAPRAKRRRRGPAALSPRAAAPPTPPPQIGTPEQVAAATAALLGGAPPLPGADLRGTVLVLGGGGRVGSSTAAALAAAAPGLTLVLGGRSPEAAAAAAARRPALAGAAFRRADAGDAGSLAAALRGVDLVVHCAGPFQRRDDTAVLEAALAAGVRYVDVADDAGYASRARALAPRAAAAGVPAVTAAGIFPGASNLLAAHLVDENGGNAAGARLQRLLYSYYVAGSGGAGPTILTTSFLLAGEPAVAYKDGARVLAPPVSNRRVVDFGAGIGRRACYLYSLPEVESARAVWGAPSASARFGTTALWNGAQWLLARAAPRALLEDARAAGALARLVGPAVRAVDALVGEAVAMRVEAEFEGGARAASLVAHRSLGDAVGVATAAFARALLAGGGGCGGRQAAAVPPGVWYPEELPRDLRRAALAASLGGCYKVLANRPAWELEREPKQLGLGIYID